MDKFCCPCNLLIQSVTGYENIEIKQVNGDSKTFACDDCRMKYLIICNGYDRIMKKLNRYTDTSKCRIEIMKPYEEFIDSTVRFNLVFGWIRVPLMYHHSNTLWISSDKIDMCRNCLDVEYNFSYCNAMDDFICIIKKFVENPTNCNYCDDCIYDQGILTKAAR